jgi:hypothetical protein
MLKTPSLMNMDFGVFPKASDHEVSSEVGWLLYSTKSQDKERPSELISALVKENVGVKWRPIRVNDHFKKEAMDSLQQNLCAAHRSSDREGCRNKAKIGDLVWFREISASRRYQDAFGSAIPNNTILCSQREILSISNQTGKFDIKALYRATWELSSNYVLDRVHSSSGLSLRKILWTYLPLYSPRPHYFFWWIGSGDLLMLSRSHSCQKTKQKRDLLLQD